MIAGEFVARHPEVAEGRLDFLAGHHGFLVGDKPGEFRQANTRSYGYRIDLR